MNYYIKQKMFSWNDQFAIKNKNGDNSFFVDGKLWSFSKKLTLFDKNHSEILKIKQKVVTLKPKYHIYYGEQLVATVKKDFSLFGNNYTIEGLNWKIQGDFLAHEYEITEDEEIIASISKEVFSWTDTYKISILNENYTDILLGVVIVIDAVLAQQNG